MRLDNFVPANDQDCLRIADDLPISIVPQWDDKRLPLRAGHSASYPSGATPLPLVIYAKKREMFRLQKIEIGSAILIIGCTITSFSKANFIEREAFIWTDDRS